jgi:hypothetical protein
LNNRKIQADKAAISTADQLAGTLASSSLPQGEQRPAHQVTFISLLFCAGFSASVSFSGWSFSRCNSQNTTGQAETSLSELVFGMPWRRPSIDAGTVWRAGAWS